MISLEAIKQLREKTGAGVMDAKKALEEAGGDLTAAEAIIREKGLSKAAKKAEREVKSGLITSYVHGGKIGALVEISCETDYVAKNEEFVALGREVAMQVASMEPATVEELLEQDYIRDSSKKIKDLLTELVAKIGENMQIRRFVRMSLGE